MVGNETVSGVFPGQISAFVGVHLRLTGGGQRSIVDGSSVFSGSSRSSRLQGPLSVRGQALGEFVQILVDTQAVDGGQLLQG